MTDSIEWGPEIAVNGVRPVWLRDEDVGLFENTKGEWIGGIHKCLSAWEWGVSEDICCPIAIRLRADHPYYVKQVTNIPTADLIAELRTRTDLPEGVVLPEPEPDWEAWLPIYNEVYESQFGNTITLRQLKGHHAKRLRALIAAFEKAPK